MVALWLPMWSRGLVAISSTTATATATAAAAVTTATATATAVTTATATAAARFAWLGFVYGKSPAPVLLAVQGRNCRLGFRIGVHLHESKAFALARRSVGDDFSTLDSSVGGQQRLQI